MAEEHIPAPVRNVLFLENSRGLGGSTVSLCNLLAHLDTGAFRPFVVFSRPEQEEYFKQFGGPSAPSVVVPVRKNLAFTAGLRRFMTTVGRRIPVLARPVLSALSLLDHL